ncbi:MAG: TATA-box-binding protein [Candidatus Thorarchaeota archaeon]
MVDLKIENVIAATELQTNLDLQKIADAVDSAEYDPDKFPGLIYKLRSPKTITLIFSRGHCVCSGATSISNAKAALTIIYKKLRDIGIINSQASPKISIQDIIVSSKYDKPLTLENISKKMPADNVEYKPNEFPALVYHDKITDIKVLIFKSGTIVGYGAPFLVNFEELLADLEEYYT